MKFWHRIVAELILGLHIFAVFLILFGWALPDMWWLYMSALVGTLVSDAIFGYCILSKWEFDLRKKYNPATDYDFSWTSYYTYKLTNVHISNRFYRIVAFTFLPLSIVINLYFKFLFNF
jgi:hypothetical protein